MIADTLRQALVDAICRTPLIETVVDRTALLTGIPSNAYFPRNAANGRGDIILLVSLLEGLYGPPPKREWLLLQLIDNVAAGVVGTELATTLKALRDELQVPTHPRMNSPAETAQVHLFDLRQPVFMCVGQLPSNGGISGFVLPGATPRLLRYFCDSLRYRGELNGAWNRGAVAATGSPLVIGPLQTSVSVAITHVKKLEKQLAVKHVLWPAYVENQADGAALWDAVNTAFAPPPQKNMIVVFGMPEQQPCPPGMQPLPPPKFTAIDIASWMSDIARAKAWNESLVQRWTAVIIMGYASGSPLPVDIVYDRLEQYHALVNEYRDDEPALLQALQDLELSGE